MVNVPSLPLLTVTLAPVLSSVTVICAFGTTAPCGSNTVPVMEPRCTCAAAKETASQKITAALSLMCFPLSERATLDAEEWDQHLTGPIHSATLLHTTSRCRTPVSKDGKYNYPVNRALRFALELEKATLFSYYDSTLSSDSPQISKLWRVRVFTQSSSRLPVLSSLNSSKQPSAFEASAIYFATQFRLIAVTYKKQGSKTLPTASTWNQTIADPLPSTRSSTLPRHTLT